MSPFYGLDKISSSFEKKVFIHAPKELDLQLKDLYEDIKKQYVDKGKTVHDFVRDYEDLRPPHLVKEWQTKKDNRAILRKKEEIDEFFEKIFYRFGKELKTSRGFCKIFFSFWCFFLTLILFFYYLNLRGSRLTVRTKKKGKVFLCFVA